MTPGRFEVGPAHDGAHPFLTLPDGRCHPEAVALLLHGGAEHGFDRTTKRSPAVLRMLAVQRSINRTGRGRIATALLRNAVWGYNDDERSPIQDAEWALDRLRALYPQLPLALVGHSLGGRVALELAGSDGVTSIVGMAPWIPSQYAAEPFLDRHTLILHGRKDVITDPRKSARQVELISRVGGDARSVQLMDSHAMLLKARLWHRHTTDFLEQTLLH